MLLNADDKATNGGALPFYLTPGAVLRPQVIEECRQCPVQSWPPVLHLTLLPTVERKFLSPGVGKVETELKCRMQQAQSHLPLVDPGGS